MEGTEMTIRRVTFIRSMVLAAALVAVGAWSPSHPAAAAGSPNCTPVGGTFMSNLGAIGGTSVPSTTLGRVTGDLSGAVAATIAERTAEWWQPCVHGATPYPDR